MKYIKTFVKPASFAPRYKPWRVKRDWGMISAKLMQKPCLENIKGDEEKQEKPIEPPRSEPRMRRTEATRQTGNTRSRMRTKNMARDVIFIHGTLAEGKTEDIYEVSAQNITSFGVRILLPITGRGLMPSH